MLRGITIAGGGGVSSTLPLTLIAPMAILVSIFF